MKIIDGCWSLIETYNCQYGAHIFDGSTAKIYVSHWLDVDGSLRESFSRRNSDGFVGHCLLVFCGVKRFDFEVTTYSNENGQAVWHKPVSFNYVGDPKGPINSFYLEGSLQGFPSSVKIEIESERFELHILDKDEPAQEG